MTHPSMMHQSISKIASVKKMEYGDVYRHIYDNTKKFYLC
jgi:TatD DNase family protein